jgi:hypothetical protein
MAFSDERLPNFPDVPTSRRRATTSPITTSGPWSARRACRRGAAYYTDLFKKIYDTEEWQGYLKSESLRRCPKAPDEQRAYWKVQVDNHTALLKAARRVTRPPAKRQLTAPRSGGAPKNEGRGRLMRIGEIVTASILALFSIYLMWKSTELPVGYISGRKGRAAGPGRSGCRASCCRTASW